MGNPRLWASYALPLLGRPRLNPHNILGDFLIDIQLPCVLYFSCFRQQAGFTVTTWVGDLRL
jgi:hypothetical protein